MNTISEELIICISKYLCNEDIYNLSYISKFYYNTLTSYFFINYIDTRYHPIVFNIFDNFCYICNRGIVCINFKDDFNIINCSHKFFIS